MKAIRLVAGGAAHRDEQREVGAGIGHAHTTDGGGVHVMLADVDAGALLGDGQDHGHATVLQAGGDPAWAVVPGGR